MLRHPKSPPVTWSDREGLKPAGARLAQRGSMRSTKARPRPLAPHATAGRVRGEPSPLKRPVKRRTMHAKKRSGLFHRPPVLSIRCRPCSICAKVNVGHGPNFLPSCLSRLFQASGPSPPSRRTTKSGLRRDRRNRGLSFKWRACGDGPRPGRQNRGQAGQR